MTDDVELLTERLRLRRPADGDLSAVERIHRRARQLWADYS